ncbi:LPD25 domain-containing protein [Paenibacillus tianjinensis]|uniref:Large polyvalent protein associated domain-containing protein n=1 Tax=Paenibacillus tianjinensis TaxID=2810347 RepID=A0ABX7L9V7_9BACL|nr:LPD25 domain-containing protein [Paenibacillus tianjinensis]QSF43514.1 hypothetical protein JRJ22_19825 [Paenibacillus tianjinensis]
MSIQTQSSIYLATSNLIGLKVFGNWGSAGWDYGIIINEYSDSYGKDIVIEWENGDTKQIDVKEVIVIEQQTDIHNVGYYIDLTGEYLSNETPVTESTNTPVAIPVQSITFKWSEASHIIADNTTVSTFTETNSLIHSVASDMYRHNEEGYTKTSFTITWADGYTHEGRIDITPSLINKYNPIGEHVKNFYESIAGLRKPSHWSEEQYKGYLLSVYKMDEAKTEEVKTMLNTYLFEDIAPSDQTCQDNDIIRELAANIPAPSERSSGASETVPEPEVFFLYSGTFPSYSDAYNHAIQNNITTSMILSNKANISYHQLMDLESAYTTNKRNMSLQDATAYYNHLVTIPYSSDSEERINALNRLIERHSNKQSAADKREAETIELIHKFESLQTKLYSLGVTKKDLGDCGSYYTKYFYNGECIYTYFSGSHVSKLYSDLLTVYDKYFKSESSYSA